jgi:hypothetical protein
VYSPIVSVPGETIGKALSLELARRDVRIAAQANGGFEGYCLSARHALDVT